MLHHSKLDDIIVCKGQNRPSLAFDKNHDSNHVLLCMSPCLLQFSRQGQFLKADLGN